MFPSTPGWVAARRLARAMPLEASAPRQIWRYLHAVRGNLHAMRVGLDRSRVTSPAAHLRQGLRAGAIAAGATFGAYALLEWALPGTSPAATYATASAAIAIAALWAGARTGVLATSMMAVVAAHSYLAPVGSLGVAEAGDRIGLALFAINGLILSLICGSVVTAPRRRTEAPALPSVPLIEAGPSPVAARVPANRSAGDRGPALMAVGEHLIERLTNREREVLVLLAGGLSNTEIADTLVVSLNTVKSHLKSIFGKLGVVSRTQAVVRAGELELLVPDGRLTARSAA